MTASSTMVELACCKHMSQHTCLSDETSVPHSGETAIPGLNNKQAPSHEVALTAAADGPFAYQGEDRRTLRARRLDDQNVHCRSDNAAAALQAAEMHVGYKALFRCGRPFAQRSNCTLADPASAIQCKLSTDVPKTRSLPSRTSQLQYKPPVQAPYRVGPICAQK